MSVNFRLPGPTPLPPQVTAALSREMIPHRGPAFRTLYRETLQLARDAHRTDGDVLTWAATGSAGWEVAIVNLLSPGDPVLVAVNGNFGERFGRVAERFGLDVRRLDVPWGQPVLRASLRTALEEHADVKAVLLVHNETSTGVTNPLRDLAAVVRDHGALSIVDAVSAAGALPLEVDAWGIDFVMSGSQKAWMCPPGLLIAAVGSRAWRAYERSTFPRFFWDIGETRKMADQGMTPTTPPLSMLFAYHAALTMIAEEGLENVWSRHRELGELTRAGVRAAGLPLFAQPGYESDTVTAFHPPDGVAAGAMLAMLRERHGVEAQGGQAHLADRLIRVGHMGWVHEPEMLDAIAAITDAAACLAAVREGEEKGGGARVETITA
ncbi:MAG: pyridoxal-phosphate-dependent aminotransferase family protein [Thermomicrobiales bacterium]